MFGTLFLVETSKKFTPLLREAHVEFKMHKTHQKGIAIDKGSLEIDFGVLEYLLNG